MYDHEGVIVFPPINGIPENLITWSDIMLTHLEYCNWTIQMGRIFKKPVIYISHNTHFDAYAFLSDNPQVGIIYNSEGMKLQSPFTNPCIVLHPSVDHKKYNVNPDPINSPYITMINCNENKGGKLFCRIAAAMPERKFLAVAGSYDEQFIPGLSNVIIRPNGPDILPVYQMTRILLMPSRYESWGMTATEAMSNGIPVIACPTFGLKENLGEAGIYIPMRDELEREDLDDGDTYDIAPIIKVIKSLDKPATYHKWSAGGRKRAVELDPAVELAATEAFLYTLVENMELASQ
ncbi:MAG: glycosyltransferase family 4 protein [Taibaiella sp.]|nr:glycosyltransferase family 4 protein [Taibaiella sp.]